MSLDRNWVPMKWPSGPLSIALRSKTKSPDAHAKEALEALAQPAALEFLKGTPVNCLIVDWAAGAPEDSVQQQALRPLLKAGQLQGVSFIGKVTGQNVAAAAQAGRAAGLAAILTDNSSGLPSDFPAILQFPKDKVEWESTSSIFSVTDNVWPGLEMSKGDGATTGPTGVPWVNSNGWISMLGHEISTAKKLWLDYDPPDSSTAADPAQYPVAIADSYAYGSRWIISLDDQLRGEILQRKSSAMDSWGRIAETIRFFQSHSEWEDYRLLGRLAVVSDFRGENAFMSGEVLNLLDRRQVQFRMLLRSRLTSYASDGLGAILWVDKESPTKDQLSKILDFVRHGGLVIAAEYWGPPGVEAVKKDPSLLYRIYNVGEGQMAVAEQGFQDPYQLAVDTHLLVSRRYDFVRLHNPAATKCHASLSPDRTKEIVHVVNYSPNPADEVTLWVKENASSARLFTLGAGKPATIQGIQANPGTDFGLPPVGVCCALEFEGKNT